jgi:Undecaprenyl-phosphate glucose phosphotransferase
LHYEQRVNPCFTLVHGMKLNPKELKFATRVDVNAIDRADGRPEFRDAVKSQLAQRRVFTPQMAVLLVGLIDAATTLGSAGATLVQYPGKSAYAEASLYAGLSLFGTGLLVVLLELFGLYQFGNLLSPFRRLPRLVLAWFITFAALTSSIFLLKFGDHFSRLWLGIWALSGFCFFLSVRFIMGGMLRYSNRDGHFNKRAILVGGGEAAGRVISIVESSRDSGVNLIGMFDDRDDERAPPMVKGLYKLGRIDDLIDFVRSTPIDTLIVTLPTSAENRLVHILNRLWILPVDIRLSAQGQKLHFRPRAYSYIGNLPCLDLFDKPLGDWGPMFKNALDKVMAAVALVVFSPLLAAVALAIKLDSKGPILFKQKRYGFNNELIEIYKFRSMYADKTDATATKLVTKGDARVTRIGRFIRRTTMDELPQLFNVLKGDLSLVGPRPHATQAKAGEALYEHVVDGYFARHRVKPGLTGWAQINGWRGETDTAEKIERRVEHDLYYIENWSVTFDLYILVATPLALLKAENAY